MKYALGVDVGSVYTKVLLLDPDKRIAAHAVLPSGTRPREAARAGREAVLRGAGVAPDAVGGTVSTGYGRRGVDFSGKVITEISAAAAGAAHICTREGLSDGRCTVIDLGGQDSKVIAVGAGGRVEDFLMNDKCAAGTGKFLEMMAAKLELDLETMVEMSFRSREPVSINSTCAVFAESEVVSLIARGKRTEDIVRGIHASITGRLVTMVRRMGIREPLLFTGGGARNRAIARLLEDEAGCRVIVPDMPQFVVSLGAALAAAADGGIS